MRIGFISTYPPIECGIATYTESLNHALRRLQNETFVMSQFGAQGEAVFPIFQARSQTFAADVFYTSTQMTPDVVHVQHEYGLYGPQKGVTVVELLLRYHLAGIPVVTTLHTVHAKPDDQEKIVVKYLVDESSAVIVHEQFQKDILESQLGPNDKIHVIEHGIREIEPVADAKAKLGLEGKKIVMLCGYFRKTKGFHEVIEWFPKICERESDAVLVMAGKLRNIEAADYRRDLFAQLHESPVADRIVLFRGQFPQYTFDTILSAADVVVLPYEEGAQSGILSQCYAMRRPVVVSDLPGFRRVIERSGGGLICKNEEDYVSSIVRVLHDDALREQLQDNIARYVRENAGWSRVALQHIDVYHSVVRVAYGKARYIYFPEPAEKTDR